MFELSLDLFKNVIGTQILNCLADPKINEIIINPNGDLIVEGVKPKHKIAQVNQNDILHAMNLLAQYRGVYLNANNPKMTVALPMDYPFNGARVQVVIPPVTQAPSLTIRKHLKREISLKSYLDQGILEQQAYDILNAAIQNHQNIIVSGQPNAGKTTLTLALLSQIPVVGNKDERIILIEDKPELIVPVEDIVYMQTSNNIDMTALVQCAVAMRPDRIIIGEVTDKAALGMLKAWNTGTGGGISTLHSNNTKATLQRLIDLCCENNIPAPISLITTTVQILVHIEKSDQFISGRKVTQISLLQGYDQNHKDFIVTDLYKFTNQSGDLNEK
ncbi:ATPase, T2SS/T4P/T4SS family [Francisella sp. TX07-6608]|uniref:ATPase, T2SS/T4P/T4SS family n=1 Tax=Francisella sp. TX07-6608 TaxID=573568 RepID=UPI0008F9B134|nr:ATPase, T2SS/T4P/T4SS family [Francisella sp. TX07-6608]OIN82970.1 type II/IV secretion system family protein [Francisella sp. TX07-6608]